jgi:hypothetical protein
VSSVAIVGAGTAGCAGAQLRFHGLAGRWMTPFFRSGRDRLAPPRDLLLGPLFRVPWIARQPVRVMAGSPLR